MGPNFHLLLYEASAWEFPDEGERAYTGYAPTFQFLDRIPLDLRWFIEFNDPVCRKNSTNWTYFICSLGRTNLSSLNILIIISEAKTYLAMLGSCSICRA